METNKVMVITGANSGLGKATSIELAKMGHTIVMVCRNQQRGEEALIEVKRNSGSQNVELMICDLSSFESIRAFCNAFKSRYPRLDVLINNAGVITAKRYTTKDGFELQLGVNYLGPFLLTQLLLDVLKASAPSRIVNVSSGAHKVGKIHFKNINLIKHYGAFKAYAQSKLALNVYTYELAEQLRGTGVTVNCLHPGGVSTNIGINRESGAGKFITSLFKPFFVTPFEGAKTSIYLATSDEIEKTTGKYFIKQKITPSSKRSYDEGVRKKLWTTSLELTGLNEENNNDI